MRTRAYWPDDVAAYMSLFGASVYQTVLYSHHTLSRSVIMVSTDQRPLLGALSI